MTTKLYKLTDREGYTRLGHPNQLLWRAGVTHTAAGDGTKLCTDGVIHAYIHPLLAVFLNPLHANFPNYRLWEAEGEVVVREGELKVGVKALTITQELPVPRVTTEHRVRFGIACAWSCGSEEWRLWARRWLSGDDRTAEAAAEAAREAADLVKAAKWAVTDEPIENFS
jgi:hypothetical protein